MKYSKNIFTMSNTRKHAIRNTYNIIYNLNINDIYNTNTLQSTIRSRIENQKTSNILQELDQKLMDWKISQKEYIKEESCPICYEQIQTNNFIVPQCGHKICLPCYKQCILSNGECANKCCLCKKQIL